MKKQICVRTYPNGYIHSTNDINVYLNIGYTVVMCNTFYINEKTQANEYILEKEVEK